MGSVNAAGKRANYFFNKVLMLYVLSVMGMTSYYTYTFTRAYGWSPWFRGGEIESFVKGMAWPYYVFKPPAERVRF